MRSHSRVHASGLAESELTRAFANATNRLDYPEMHDCLAALTQWVSQAQRAMPDGISLNLAQPFVATTAYGDARDPLVRKAMTLMHAAMVDTCRRHGLTAGEVRTAFADCAALQAECEVRVEQALRPDRLAAENLSPRQR